MTSKRRLTACALALAVVVFGSVAIAGPEHDLTGDGKSDVLVRNESTGRWFLFPMSGRQVVMGAHRGPVKLTSKLLWQPVGVADFTGDGKADVLIRNTGTGQWFLYPMDGLRPVRGADRGPVKLTGSLSWEPVALADFTGDGKADVLVRHQDTGRWYLYPMDARRVLKGPDLGPVALPDASWRLAGAADFTGDGKADVLVRHGSTGEWSLYPMNGRSVLTGADRGSVALPTPLDWQPAGLADLTGDGKADALVRNMNTGEWSLYPLDGRRVVSGAHLGAVDLTDDLAWSVEQVEDFTGDGRADVLVRNTETGEWSMYPMNGRSVVFGNDHGEVGMTRNSTWQTVRNPPVVTHEPPPPAAPVDEVPDGTWSLRITCDGSDCGDGVTSETLQYSIERLSDTRLEIRTPTGVYPAEFRGDLITWSVSYPADGGTVTETGAMRIHGDAASGQASWTWTDGRFACEGTCTYEATRLAGDGPPAPPPPPPVEENPEGTWSVTIRCDATGCGEGVTSETLRYSIERVSRTEVQVRTPTGAYRARFRGDLITWSVRYREDGGTVTETGTMRIRGDSATGQASWSWTDGRFACEGTCTYTASR